MCLLRRLWRFVLLSGTRWYNPYETFRYYPLVGSLSSCITILLMIVIGASQVVPWQRIHLPMQETQETWVWFLDQEDPQEEEMATHSSILAWRIPWTIYGVVESDVNEWLSMMIVITKCLSSKVIIVLFWGWRLYYKVQVVIFAFRLKSWWKEW